MNLGGTRNEYWDIQGICTFNMGKSLESKFFRQTSGKDHRNYSTVAQWIFKSISSLYFIELLSMKLVYPFMRMREFSSHQVKLKLSLTWWKGGTSLSVNDDGDVVKSSLSWPHIAFDPRRIRVNDHAICSTDGHIVFSNIVTESCAGDHYSGAITSRP